MTFSNELFQMYDFMMTDPSLLPSSRQQLSYASNDTCINTTVRDLGNSHDLTYSLFPIIDNQSTQNTATSNNELIEQPTCFDIWQQYSYSAATTEAEYLDQYFFEQGSVLQSTAITTNTTEIQPIPMIRTPDLCSVHTGSYSSTFHVPTILDDFNTLGLNTMLFPQEQIQQEFTPSFYEPQHQEFLMVSPLSQFDMMHSPSDSHSIMEEHCSYSATPPVQSPCNFSSNGDSISSIHTNITTSPADSTITNIITATTTTTTTTNKPRYDCLECDKDFGRPQELNRHHQSLHTEKKYRCNCCDKPFGRKDALRRHEKSKKLDRQKRHNSRKKQDEHSGKIQF